MDPEKLKRALTKGTKVVMSVHLFGQAATLAPIRELAAEARPPRD